MAAALAAGCSSERAGSDTAPPSAWTWEGAAPDEEADAEALSEATQALVDSLRSVTASPVLSSYYEAMSYGLEWCPSQTETSSEATGDMRYWDGMCEGQQGVWFKGPMTTWTWDGIDIGAGSVDIISEILGSSPSFDGYLFYGNGIRGQTDIFDPTGAIDFNCSCTAMQGMGMAEDGRVGFFSFMDGPAHWTGPASEGTWMAEGWRPGLWTWAEVDPGAEMKQVTVAGNLTGFTERFDTARLDANVFRPTDGSLACTAGELSSLSLRVRDAETADWYDLAFAIEASEDSCLATAALESGAVVVVDLASLVSWEGAPW